MSGKKAVVLFNLGGPDSQDAVKPFLFNLFSDPNIIGLPNPFRHWLAKFISSKREKTAQEIYGHIGGKSPLLEQTNAQALALEDMLEEKDPVTEYRVFVCMRYWHPMTKEVVAQVKDYEPDEIILLPLYPQYSTTTSGSSFELWEKEAKSQGLDAPAKRFCCYPTEENFLQAHVKRIKAYYKKAERKGNVRILFSAHGLPEKIIKNGDPYQYQVEQTAQSVVDRLVIKNLDWQVCYQSKVGPLTWIGPSTEDEIERAGDDGVSILIVPIAFVSEHSETLVELDIEYKELADNAGVVGYFRVPTLSGDKDFIHGLAEICLQKGKQGKTCSNFNSRVCPAQWNKCPNNFYDEAVS